jgi:regulator of sigma E protease
MTDFFLSAGAFVVTLGVLITFHELGHFWVARRFGVKVLRFSIGFGHPLWSRRSGPDRTEFVIASLPLGGYVQMLDEREGEVAPAERPRAFNTQPLGVRAAVVAAGPVFNFMLAVVVYWLMFVIGVEGLRPLVGEVAAGSAAARAGLEKGELIEAVNGRPTPTWEAVTLQLLEGALQSERVDLRVASSADGSVMIKQLDLTRTPPLKERGNVLENVGLSPGRPPMPAVIDKVLPDTPAQRAGLQPGDEVSAADGTPIGSWSAWVDYVRARPQTPIRVEVRRNSEHRTLTVVPELTTDDNGEQVGRIGAAVRVPEGFAERWRAEQRYPVGEALVQALSKTWEMSELTLRLLAKMLMLEASVENLSGPISIAQYAGQSASIGLAQFLAFLGLVSLSLGILNLLPIPVLDGGHLLYYAIELVKGSPVSEQTLLWGQKIGAALLILLMTLAVYNDIVRLLVK